MTQAEDPASDHPYLIQYFALLDLVLGLESRQDPRHQFPCYHLLPQGSYPACYSCFDSFEKAGAFHFARFRHLMFPLHSWPRRRLLPCHYSSLACCSSDSFEELAFVAEGHPSCLYRCCPHSKPAWAVEELARVVEELTHPSSL